MNLLIDSESAADLEGPMALGLCDGAVTRGGVRVVEALLEATSGPVLAVVAGADAEALLSAARRLGELDDRVIATLPVTSAGLAACAVCYEEGIPTAVGPCDSPTQALLAAKAGATWVVVSLSRLDARGGDGAKVLDDTLHALSTYDLEAQLLVTGVAHAQHLQDAVLAGAHAAVVTPELLDGILAAPQGP